MTELRDELTNYFGAVTEFENGLRKELPDKPEILVLYDQCVSTGLPLFDGGLMNQPHIWILQYKVCGDITRLFDAIKRANSKPQNERS